jgi:predicted MFS family arabinose efflux permease
LDADFRSFPMSILTAARLSHAQIAALSAIGVFWGSFAVMVPSFKAGIGASDAVMGLCLMMSSFGGIIAMYIAPKLGPLLGRGLLPAACAVLAGVAALPTLAGTPPVFGAAMFCLGATMSFFDMSANMRIAVLEDRHGTHLQNLNHAMFSFSFAASAFVTTLARSGGWSPADVLPWLMLTLAVLAVACDEGRGWTPSPSRHDHGGATMPWATVLVVAVILFAAFLSESANEGWSALHIERTLGAPAGEGGLGPTMLGLTMGMGRLSGQMLTARLGDVRLIFWGAILGVAGLLMLALAPTKETAVAGVGLFGLGVAVMIPTANAILGRMVKGGLQGLAISRAWMVGFTGFFVGPSMIGAVAEATNLRVAFLVVAAIMATILPMVAILKRRGA